MSTELPLNESERALSATAVDAPNIAAICWLTHEVRTASYAHYLNATLYNIHYLSNRSVYFAPFKYIPQCLKTWLVLAKQSPDVVYVMNPPVFAVLSVYLFSWLTKTPFVMDTHSPSLYGRRWGWTLPLQRWLAQRALVNIVDQERFAQLFAEWGAESIVLERPPLDVAKRYSKASGAHQEEKSADSHPSASNPSQQEAPFHVTLIGQFASDEPVDVVVDAASRLPHVTFSILGDRFQAPRHLLESAPANVRFEGYLSGSDYWDHLASVDAVMTLTTFEYSLLGGAQEGMAMGKPLILSKQPVLTDYFTKGTVFIEHNTESVVRGVQSAQRKRERLEDEIKALAIEKRTQWEERFKALREIIGSGVSKQASERRDSHKHGVARDVSLS